MNRLSLLRLYHALPHPARQVAASLHGLVLRSWRYGPETERLVAGALERDSWTAAQWVAWREERLALLLRRAATTVPYYRTQWSERRRRGDRSSLEVLRNWPVLTKEEVRRAPLAFVAEDRDVRRLFAEHTSGTTGTPLRLWWSGEAVRGWYAVFEARVRRWNSVTRKDRWAILGGQLVVPVDQERPPFWVWNAGLRQLYLSAYHVAPRNVAAYVEALWRYRVRSLLGYPSALSVLAHAVRDGRLRFPELRVILTNAEPLLRNQRKAIEEAFGCPVRETYGMAEIVAGASECAEGRLHTWPEVGVVEILREAGSAAADPGEAGRLVGTGLLNADMPLIRYDTGDSAAIGVSADVCACGRRLPVLECLEGRADDVIVTPDGRRVGRLDPVFKGDLPIVEAQIVQEHVGAIVVRVVPTREFASADADEIARRLRDRVGKAVAVTVETVAEIPRGANGKFRAVVSRVAQEKALPSAVRNGAVGGGW